jgi:hypothetical protein
MSSRSIPGSILSGVARLIAGILLDTAVLMETNSICTTSQGYHETDTTVKDFILNELLPPIQALPKKIK